MEQGKLLTLLQLSDSVFPIGGFSHSLGLEACVQNFNGKKIDPCRLHSIFSCILENAGSFAIPFVKASHAANGNNQLINEIDEVCEACTPNHIARKANRKQGGALVEVVGDSFDGLTEQYKNALYDMRYCHYPVVFGAIMAELEYPLDVTETTFMSYIVRSLIASAVRLDVIGPMEGQRIQVRLQNDIPDILQRNVERTIDRVCIKFPVIDILQNTQDTFFCKLFYS